MLYERLRQCAGEFQRGEDSVDVDTASWMREQLSHGLDWDRRCGTGHGSSQAARKGWKQAGVRS